MDSKKSSVNKRDYDERTLITTANNMSQNDSKINLIKNQQDSVINKLKSSNSITSNQSSKSRKNGSQMSPETKLINKSLSKSFKEDEESSIVGDKVNSEMGGQDENKNESLIGLESIRNLFISTKSILFNSLNERIILSSLKPKFYGQVVNTDYFYSIFITYVPSKINFFRDDCLFVIKIVYLSK